MTECLPDARSAETWAMSTPTRPSGSRRSFRARNSAPYGTVSRISKTTPASSQTKTGNGVISASAFESTSPKIMPPEAARSAFAAASRFCVQHLVRAFRIFRAHHQPHALGQRHRGPLPAAIVGAGHAENAEGGERCSGDVRLHMARKSADRHEARLASPPLEIAIDASPGTSRASATYARTAKARSHANPPLRAQDTRPAVKLFINGG